MVERFNRTMKTAMWKRLDEMNSRRWIDILDDLIDYYNNERIHSSIGVTPYEASQKENEDELREYQYEDVKKLRPEDVKTKFNMHDIVRISRVKGTFEKGYMANWSRELFEIVKFILLIHLCIN